MNRALATVCLVGLVFAVGALADEHVVADNEKIISAERAALAQESAALTELANLYHFNPRTGNPAQRQWMPVISHLIRSIEHTRRITITDTLKNSKESATFKQDLTDAHAKAYKEVNLELVELTKALAAIDDSVYAINQIEDLLMDRIKQVENY